MNIETVNKLYEAGILMELTKAGFVSPKIFTYRQIYLWVDLQIKTRNISKRKAVSEAEIMFKLSSTTIWIAVGSFN